jgi:hypothetical protein
MEAITVVKRQEAVSGHNSSKSYWLDSHVRLLISFVWISVKLSANEVIEGIHPQGNYHHWPPRHLLRVVLCRLLPRKVENEERSSFAMVSQSMLHVVSPLNDG